MEIKKAATAGTLETSDCMVTVEPGEGKIDFSLESSVIQRPHHHRGQGRTGLHPEGPHRGRGVPLC